MFCGSTSGVRPIFRESAAAFASLLAQRGIAIVYGGGHVGLMGVLADAALAAGARVTGVIPKALADREVAHDGLTELHVVDTMHQRKAMMADLADAFVAMPGGFGTFEEFFEAVTWTQLGVHHKPCGLLNIDGYFDPLLAACDRALDEGFLLPRNRRLIVASTDGAELLHLLATLRIPHLPATIRPEQT